MQMTASYSIAGEQKMADLPLDRVTPDLPPFPPASVDYFGPIEVRRGCALVKRCGVIFTCLVSRAVHLEVASQLDTHACINAIQLFICRQGSLKSIRSRHQLHRCSEGIGGVFETAG